MKHYSLSVAMLASLMAVSACKDSTSIQRDFISHRDSCRAKANSILGIYIQPYSGYYVPPKDQNSAENKIYCECMKQHEWQTMGCPKPPKPGDKPADKPAEKAAEKSATPAVVPVPAPVVIPPIPSPIAPPPQIIQQPAQTLQTPPPPVVPQYIQQPVQNITPPAPLVLPPQTQPAVQVVSPSTKNIEISEPNTTKTESKASEQPSTPAATEKPKEIKPTTGKGSDDQQLMKLLGNSN